jgi:aryl-alcohol dehydrogenase-like predicted oxidoreductase
MANGRLAGPAAPAPLRTVADQTGATPDAVALAFVLRHPWADVVLSGAATTAQLTTNLRAATVTLTDTQHSHLTTLTETPPTYWTHRSRLPWH